MAVIRVGVAGWSIPSVEASHFPGQGTHLERYARVLPAVEINTSFYRPHQPKTYARWADSTPDGFRFAVKIPKSITHTGHLSDLHPLEQFLEEVRHLGNKLGLLLVQLPPSQRFNASTAGAFFHSLRSQFDGEVVCEPRHGSWFDVQAEDLLAEWRVARVAADPAPHPAAGVPGGWDGLKYYRLHGSPRMYYSEYSIEYLERLAQELTGNRARGIETWCIFDNTAEFAALRNALKLLSLL